MAEVKQLALVVEYTPSLRLYWETFACNFLQKIIRLFYEDDPHKDPPVSVDLVLVDYQNILSSNHDLHHPKHCILVAARDPSVRSLQKMAEAFQEKLQSKFRSVSIICPKELPNLRWFYNAVNVNPSTMSLENLTNPTLKYVVLISKSLLDTKVHIGWVYEVPQTPDYESLQELTDISSLPSEEALYPVLCEENLTNLDVKLRPESIWDLHSETSLDTNEHMDDGERQLKRFQLNPTPLKKIWEGRLCSTRDVFLTRSSISTAIGASTKTNKGLADNWPGMMSVAGLLPQDDLIKHMRIYVGRVDRVFFKAKDENNYYLNQVHEKKLCSVVKLYSQTLILYSKDDPNIMIGLVFPQDSLKYKSQLQIYKEGNGILIKVQEENEGKRSMKVA
ncbi:hypothetical protein Lser_V15G15952 [Lactuca serriola]